MKGKLFLLFFATLFIFSCGNNEGNKVIHQPIDTLTKKISSGIKPGLIVGTEIVKFQKIPNVYMMGRIGDTLIYCSEKGKIEISDTLHKIRHQIVDLKVSIMVNKIYIIPTVDHKWFFFWEETFQDGIRTFAALYQSESPKPEWKIMFPVPNPAPPVMDGNSTYISTLGIVAKINLNDGRFIWKHDSLFNQKNFAFQKTEKALVYTDKVVFVDFPKSGLRETRDTLVLDPITGERKK